jgi:leader peptidase (prepilin peptidase)/N-methyltransferase
MPISPRYPLVELCVGLSLTLVGWGGIYHGGSNLPYFSTSGLGDGLWMPHLTKTSLAIGTYQLLVVTGSWAFGLIRFDGQRIPTRLLAWVFAIAIIPLLLWPPLQIVPWEVRVTDGWQPSSYVASMLRVVTALAAAGVIGRGLGRTLAPRGDIKMNPLGEQTSRLLDLIAMLAVPALVVGWQALFGVGLAACLLAILLGRWMPQRDGLARLAVALPPSLAVQLAAWRWLDASPFWPGTHSYPWTLLGFAFAMLIVAPWLKRAARQAAPAETTRAASPEAAVET